jgi:hypothetical protein
MVLWKFGLAPLEDLTTTHYHNRGVWQGRPGFRILFAKIGHFGYMFEYQQNMGSTSCVA